ncbi:MAG TPA: DEAD/DEAH box helicase [Nocardioidaceae bacterium]|nr:DEAD/DEAH box helicase [Nocardioidaceae bacterium]
MADTHASPAHATPVTTFRELGLPAPLVAALADAGVTSPFPIQSATLPDSLSGRDVLGRGRTGSGKTSAFVLPLLARLAANPSKRRANRPRALVLAPTRELASQIEAAMAPLAKVVGLRTVTIFGGVGPHPQITALRNGVDIVIACPGRLADHVQSGHADLGSIEVTVLDEADHMADLGFLPVVRRLMDKTPAHGQRMLFSATLDGGVDVLVKRFLHDPVTHSVDSAQSPVSQMTHHVLHVSKEGRVPVLAELTAAPGKTIVFTRTKHGAKALARQLNSRGVPAVELHGNLAQNARTRNLTAFGDGTATTLVATDIAARGIHVDDVALVVHADPPVEHKAYLHRSGRTARAGNEGTVVTLMMDAQVGDVRDLTRKAGIKPTITRTQPGDSLLTRIAPGERTYAEVTALPQAQPSREGRNASGGRGRGARAGGRGAATTVAPRGARTGGGGTGGGARTGGAPQSSRRRGGAGSGSTPVYSSTSAHSAASFSGSRRSR